MVKSMTGYGYAEHKGAAGIVTVEIKSVNHKYLDISTAIPELFSEMDDKIRDFVRTKIKRGKIYMSIKFESTIQGKHKVYIDKELVKNYLRKIQLLQKQFDITGEVTIRDIINLPGAMKYSKPEENIRRVWPDIKKAMVKALEKFLKNREKEGVYIMKDVIMRIHDIEKTKTQLKAYAKTNVRDYKAKLAKKIKALTGNGALDREKLENEVAAFAKNCDITEEVVRLRSHLLNFKRVLQREKHTGKKLDFISQEMQREVNTVGAKANNYKISQSVIHIKSQIEKIREQLKNIE